MPDFDPARIKVRHRNPRIPLVGPQAIAAALPVQWSPFGRQTVMVGGSKTLVMLAVALVPGGLVVLAAWILGRVVAHRFGQLPGAHAARLARAVASVRWREVWSETRRQVLTANF